MSRRRAGVGLKSDTQDAVSDCSRTPALSPSDVWRALAEIPDPEIPVISLVDLGVVTAVEVRGKSVTSS